MRIKLYQGCWYKLPRLWSLFELQLLPNVTILKHLIYNIITVQMLVLVVSLPCAHAQGVKQLVCPSVVCTKIVRSQVIGICGCCKYNQSVDISEKLVCMRFELLKQACQCYKLCIFCLACLWFIDRTQSTSMCWCDCTCSSTVLEWVIKSQNSSAVGYYARVATERAGYVLYRALVVILDQLYVFAQSSCCLPTVVNLLLCHSSDGKIYEASCSAASASSIAVLRASFNLRKLWMAAEYRWNECRISGWLQVQSVAWWLQ